MSRLQSEPSQHTQIIDNLLIHNYQRTEGTNHGPDLIMEQPPDNTARAAMDNISDYNVFARKELEPLVGYDWNEKLPLPQWQERFRQDTHSSAVTIQYEMTGTGFYLLSLRGLNTAPAVPPAVTRVWIPKKSSRVGADITDWPRR
jgi:hypothetical protein